MFSFFDNKYLEYLIYTLQMLQDGTANEVRGLTHEYKVYVCMRWAQTRGKKLKAAALY